MTTTFDASAVSPPGFVVINPDHHVNSHFDYFRHLIKGGEANAEVHLQDFCLVKPTQTHATRPSGMMLAIPTAIFLN